MNQQEPKWKKIVVILNVNTKQIPSGTRSCSLLISADDQQPYEAVQIRQKCQNSSRSKCSQSMNASICHFIFECPSANYENNPKREYNLTDGCRYVLSNRNVFILQTLRTLRGGHIMNEIEARQLWKTHP